MGFGITQDHVAVQLDETPPATPRVEAPRNRDNIYGPFDSTIGDLQDGYRPFTLIVRAFLDPYPPGRHFFQDTDANGRPDPMIMAVDEMTPSDIATFKRNAIDDVNAAWNGNGRGRLWLTAVDITRGYRGLGSDAIPPPLKCLVELSWVPLANDAHLRVCVLNTGDSSRPRSSCWLGGKPHWSTADMTMHHFQAGQVQDNSGWRIAPGPNAPLPNPGPKQRVFAHEFGHFITLRHPFSGRSGVTANASQEYGIGMNSREMFYYIMGVGMDMSGRATAPWRRQLVRHGYFPNRTFRATPVDRQAESVREREGWSLRAPPRVQTVRMIHTRAAE
jgi:hypothetical protein